MAEGEKVQVTIKKIIYGKSEERQVEQKKRSSKGTPRKK